VADPHHPVDHEDHRGSTDTSKDLEFTDWDKVRGFARDFGQKSNSDVIQRARALRAGLLFDKVGVRATKR
jgi:hypothetical protein